MQNLFAHRQTIAVSVMTISDAIWDTTRQALADEFDIPATEQQTSAFLARLLMKGYVVVPIDLLSGVSETSKTNAMVDAERALRAVAKL